MTKERIMRRIQGCPVLRVMPAILVGVAGSSRTLAVPPLPFPPTIELSSLNGSDGFAVNGIDAGDLSGTSVSSAGDINGDGIDDLVIGAIRADPNGMTDAGETYIVFGGSGVGSTGSLDLSALDGTNGFVIIGIDPNDISGVSVSTAGDVNCDGVSDILIGARQAAPNGKSSAGECYVVFGGPSVGAGGSINLSTLNGADGFVLNGVKSNDYCGWSVAPGGDINGDGMDDILIGARNGDPPSRSNAGQTYVVFGAPGIGASGAIELSALNGTDGFTINGSASSESSGGSVAGLGDVNGDGIDDLVIGAHNAFAGGRSRAGKSYVVFGGSGVGASGVLDLAALNGANGFVCNGIDTNDYSGGSVAAAGDVNGDGVNDILIGAAYADPGGRLSAGEAYVVFGGIGVGGAGSFNLSSLNGTNGFIINGIDAGDLSAVSVSGAGDANSDGFGDLLIGAKRADPNGQASAGESYVVFGGPGVGASGVVELAALTGANGVVLNGIDTVDESGRSVSLAGDVNNDGVSDMIIGAWASPHGQIGAGESYVVFGRAPVPVCAGDITGDGLTNSADFNILAGNFGAGPGATPAQGDLTGDGFVNSADFNVLAGDFGCGAP